MEEYISLSKAQAQLFHSFDARTVVYSSLEKDPCPEYDPFAINDLKEFEAPVLTELGISIHDEEVQKLLSTPVPLLMFLDMNQCHVKFTSLYVIDRYLEGNIPGTLETFGTPYIPDNELDLFSYMYSFAAKTSKQSTSCNDAFSSSNCSFSSKNTLSSSDSTTTYIETNEQETSCSTVPFYLVPEFYLKHITPTSFHPVYDMALRPHYIELMHFRDRYPYVESSFLFLQNILRRKANYYFAYRYYGSFQGVQQSFRYMMDIDELSDLVRYSPYFTKNMRKLFYMSQEDIVDFYRETAVDDENSSSTTPRSFSSREEKRVLPSDKLRMYSLYIKQLPVHVQLMEKLEGMNLYNYVLKISQVSPTSAVPEQHVLSIFAQIAVQLDMYQFLFDFRHNDLHGQNVMLTKLPDDSRPVDFLEIDQFLLIPIFQGQIAQLIDFGRVKFTFQGEQYFSDEMSPWGAVGDHCNSKSSAYFQPNRHCRPVPKPFDMAYLCCMIAQYLSVIGGEQVYRTFLERYPRVFEFMYECTKRKNGGSFLETGMKFIRNVVWPVMENEDLFSESEEVNGSSSSNSNGASKGGKKRKRNIANHRLIEPASVSFDSNLVLALVDWLDESIDPIHVLKTNPRLVNIFQPRWKRKNVLQFSKTQLSNVLLSELKNIQQSTNEEKERNLRLQKHRICQGQVLNQIRKRFHGKLQNPFSCKDDERDFHDVLDSF